MGWLRNGESKRTGGPGDSKQSVPVPYMPGFDGPASAPKETMQLNVQAVLLLLLVIAFIPAVYFPLTHYRNERALRATLADVRRLADEGQAAVALAQVTQLLTDWPDDIEALEIHARLLTETARTPEQALDAARAHDQLIRLDPKAPERQQNRARLVELYVAYADAIRRASARRETASEKYESSYRAAVKMAQQRITLGADDAESHRLLGRALEGLALTGDAKALVDSSTEYEIALRRDHRDAAAAEHLAIMNLERRNEPIMAEQILDNLVRAAPDSVDARLARHRFFLKTHREDRAGIDLLAALGMKPTDLRVRLTAAGDAIRRRDPSAARGHLDAISAGHGQDQQILVLRRQIDLVEQHPEQAIDEWRKAIALLEGNEQEFSGLLAHILILLGRVGEAAPLVDQLDRLNSDSTNATARFLHGLIEQRTGRPAAAIVNLEAARLTIDESTLVDVELTLGRCYEAINDQQRAETSYRRAIEAAPLSSDAQRAFARQLARKSIDKASEQLEEANRLIPTDPWILADLANLRLSQQRSLPLAGREPSLVRDLVDRAGRLGLDDLAVLKLRADSIALYEGVERALPLYEEASRGPLGRKEGLWQGWSMALIQLGRPAEAIALLEKASKPGLASDHASFRTIRARLLAQDGHGGEARKLLDERVEDVPESERAALALARLDLLQGLGEIREARAACLDWARIDKQDPRPGLRLMTLARVEGAESDESARLGISILKGLGGDGEPYSLAAQILDLLTVTRSSEARRAARLEKADELSQKLQKIAPFLPINSLVRGMVLERSERIEEAINEYRKAVRGDTAALALSRIVSILVRLKRPRDLVSLKRELGISEPIDHFSASTCLEIGDTEAASKLVSQLVESIADPISTRNLKARIYRHLGQPTEIRATLRALIERDKSRPEPWLALLVFQISQGLRDEAGKTAEQAIDSYEGNQPEAFFARCRWLVGDQREAARLFNEALGRHPNDVAILKLATGFAEASGRRVEAEKLLRTVLKLDPSAPWASRRLALLISSRGDRSSWDEAWYLLSSEAARPEDTAEVRLIRATLLERSPYSARRLESFAAWKDLAQDYPVTNRFAFEARVHLAKAALEIGDAVDAARWIGPVAVGRDASDPDILALLVEALARSGQLDEAGTRLDRLIALEPKALITACCRAWVDQARDRKAEASSALQQAFDEVGNAADASTSGLTLARQLLCLGELDAAERIAAKVASKSPRDGCLLAKVQARAGRFTQALETCRSAINAGAGRDASQVLFELATSPRSDESTHLEACKIAESILSRSPQDPALVLLVGARKHREGKFEEESRIYEREIRADPTFEAAWNKLAWVIGECLDRPAEALVKIDELIRLSGRKPSYCDTRGVLLTRLGKLDEAIRDLETAVADQPTPIRLFHLARACLNANQNERYAKYRDLARTAKLDPDVLDSKDRADYQAVIGP